MVKNFKEYGNGYYSCFSYFMSKIISDIPFTLLLPNLGSFLIYYLTGQYFNPIWRVFNFAFIFLMVSFNSSALGFLIGASFSEYRTAIAFLGLISLVPMMLLSGNSMYFILVFINKYRFFSKIYEKILGIMIRLHIVPFYFRWLSYADYMRFGVVSALINSYGFDRCSEVLSSKTNETDMVAMISPEKLLEVYSSDKIDAELLMSTLDSIFNGISDKTKSVVMSNFQLEDSDYYFSIMMLFIHLIIIRSVSYFVIVSKIRAKS